MKQRHRQSHAYRDFEKHDAHQTQPRKHTRTQHVKQPAIRRPGLAHAIGRKWVGEGDVVMRQDPVSGAQMPPDVRIDNVERPKEKHCQKRIQAHQAGQPRQFRIPEWRERRRHRGRTRRTSGASRCFSVGHGLHLLFCSLPFFRNEPARQNFERSAPAISAPERAARRARTQRVHSPPE